MIVEETFFRMLRHREFDVAEMSMSSYTVSLHRDPQPFVAIPVFPSRFFRHSSIYVSRQSGIETPADLVGKRVGCPEYQTQAAVGYNVAALDCAPKGHATVAQVIHDALAECAGDVRGGRQIRGQPGRT